MAPDVGGLYLFAGCLMLSWTQSSILVTTTTDFQYSGVVRPGRPSIALLLMSATFLGLLVAWVLGIAQGVMGIAMLAAMYWIRIQEKAKWPPEVVVPLGKYVPSAACLMGYTVAWWICLGTGADHSLCWDAACGILAAMWTWAGISKLELGGARWFSSGALGLLVAERSLVGPAPARWLRRTLVRSPLLCLILGGYGLLVELCGFLFCVPSLRPFFALNSTALLIGIALLLGYIEIEWTLLAVALAWVTF